MDLKEYVARLYDRGDDPFNLAGKRDDTWKMVLAMLDQQGVDPPMTEPQQEQPVDPPRPEQNSWESFMQMNPNLNLDKVAQQAGGKPGSFPVENKYGGAISDNSRNYLPPDQTNEAFIKWVKEMEFKNKFDDFSDPRKRTYNPDAAKLLLEQAKLDDEARRQSFYEKAASQLYGQQGGVVGGGRIPAQTAMAMMNAGMEVPSYAIDSTPTTRNYHEEVFRLRAGALSFLDRVGSDAMASAMVNSSEEGKRAYEYNKKIVEITQKYPEDPQRAYMEIMKIQRMAQPGGGGGVAINERNDGTKTIKLN